MQTISNNFRKTQFKTQMFAHPHTLVVVAKRVERHPTTVTSTFLENIFTPPRTHRQKNRR